MSAYIVKCKCGAVKCSELNEFVQAAITCSYSHSPFTTIEKYRCNGETYERPLTYWRNADFRCLTCARYFKVSVVRGKVKPEHKCDARCLASTGPNCECACGGKNHGGAYA